MIMKMIRRLMYLLLLHPILIMTMMTMMRGIVILIVIMKMEIMIK